MADITSLFEKITEEATRTRRPVSEFLMQLLGGSINGLFDRPGIGSIIKASELTEAEFQDRNGDGWVLADGQDVTGSDWALLTGETVAPNLYDPIFTPWESYAGLSGNATTNATYTGYMRRVMDTLHANARMDCSGALTFPGNTDVAFSSPTGLNFDTVAGSDVEIFGIAELWDNSAVTMFHSHVKWQSATQVKIGQNGLATGSGNWRSGTPVTFAADDFVQVNFQIPIVEWAGTKNYFIRINLD